MVVLFDGEHSNHRVAIDAEYKSNRTDYSVVSDDNNPFSQLPDVYAALDFMQIKHTELTCFEADDVIASYAITYGANMKIIISSYDSDFFQLINENVSVLRYRGRNTIICNSEYINMRYGIAPWLYAEFKSLVGDKSDNIKGVSKVGPKTAADLLNQFGSLEEIVKNVDKIKKPSIWLSISENTQRITKNYQLIKLDNKADLPFELNEILYYFNNITTYEVLQGINLK